MNFCKQRRECLLNFELHDEQENRFPCSEASNLILIFTELIKIDESKFTREKSQGRTEENVTLSLEILKRNKRLGHVLLLTGE